MDLGSYPGINPDILAALAKAGIRTDGDLVKAMENDRERKRLASKMQDAAALKSLYAKIKARSA
jgi:hypothetical protein